MCNNLQINIAPPQPQFLSWHIIYKLCTEVSDEHNIKGTVLDHPNSAY